MDLRELYYLNALAEEQSISKAAERLYIAQASLSQFLRQFEAQLGSPIFVRTNKGIRPTPSGKVFLSHAKHILKEYQQAQQEFWDNENTVGGTVFFGVSSFRGSYVIPPILKKFYDQNPRATINIYEALRLPHRQHRGHPDGIPLPGRGAAGRHQRPPDLTAGPHGRDRAAPRLDGGSHPP